MSEDNTIIRDSKVGDLAKKIVTLINKESEGMNLAEIVLALADASSQVYDASEKEETKSKEVFK